MLNLFNNNNYSLLNNNLLSYGLILGSVSILGFSMYYFSGTLFKQDLGMVTNSLPDISSENINITTQTIINNLKFLNLNLLLVKIL
jgi:hypothetical protein